MTVTAPLLAPIAAQAPTGRYRFVVVDAAPLAHLVGPAVVQALAAARQTATAGLAGVEVDSYANAVAVVDYTAGVFHPEVFALDLSTAVRRWVGFTSTPLPPTPNRYPEPDHRRLAAARAAEVARLFEAAGDVANPDVAALAVEGRRWAA